MYVGVCVYICLKHQVHVYAYVCIGNESNTLKIQCPVGAALFFGQNILFIDGLLRWLFLQVSISIEHFRQMHMVEDLGHFMEGFKIMGESKDKNFTKGCWVKVMTKNLKIFARKRI